MNATIMNYAFLFYFLSFVLSLIYATVENKKIEKIFLIILLFAISSNGFSILVRWLEARRPPFAGLYESMILLTFFFSFGYFIITKYYKSKLLHIIFSFLTLIFSAYTSILNSDIRPLMPALKSNWLILHVFSYMLSYGLLAVTFIISIIIIIFHYTSNNTVFSNHIKTKKINLQKLNFQIAKIAFTFLNLGLLTGSVWAKEAWGDYWSWDPKEIWALICWIFYVNYFHLSFSLRKIFKKISKDNLKIIETIYLILGFLLILFTYLGMRYLPSSASSLHIYN
jgi:cytochrome c-type biogenesis protein CcsB